MGNNLDINVLKQMLSLLKNAVIQIRVFFPDQDQTYFSQSGYDPEKAGSSTQASVVDPFSEFGSGSVFGIRIRIHTCKYRLK